jgi:hypothetical protein
VSRVPFQTCEPKDRFSPNLVWTFSHWKPSPDNLRVYFVHSVITTKSESVWEQGSKKNIWTENGGSCRMRSFIFCIQPEISLGWSDQWDWGGRGMWHAWERKGNVQGFGGKVRRKKTTRETEV